MEVIYLDQPTAKTMTDMKGLVKAYTRQNKSGQYDENISRYQTIYSNLMNEVLER